MRLDTPQNRRGCQIGAKNKATLSNSTPTETLMEWEECRLKAYIDAMHEVRVGPGHNRGSVNDLIRLAARHRSVRGHLINTIRDGEVIQATLGPTEEVYHARLSAEVEKLVGVDIFGQYTPDAMDKTQGFQDDALAEQIEEYVPSLFGLLDTLCRTTNKTVQRNRRRIVSILSIICFIRHPMKCNFLPAMESAGRQTPGSKNVKTSGSRQLMLLFQLHALNRVNSRWL
jgi:hypothetical protein